MPPPWRIFLGYLLLLYGCNSNFSLGSTVVIFSTWSFRREAEGEKREKVFVMKWLRSPFPEAAYIVLAETSELLLPQFPSTASIPFCLREPPWRPLGLRLTAQKFIAVFSLPFVQMEKLGKGWSYPERGQRKSWSPGATNRWITKCFTVPRTSLGIGKCDFCLRSSKLLLDKLRSSFSINPFPTHTLRGVWSIIMVWLLLWGHFNKLTLKVIWRFLWQKETYKVNCFFSSQTFVLHYHALNRHTSLLITWICMDLKLVYWRIKDSSSFIAFIHKGSFESPRFWKSSI